TKFPIFDYSIIRPAGKKIRGFGGTSSGFEPLKKLHERVESFLDNFCAGFIEVDGKKKEYNHTRLIADIFNSIGACVVAGNVRRSAEICIGDVDDETFMNLKNYEMNPERMDIGWMSNNSVSLKERHNYSDFSYIPEFANRVIDNGEPGMINLVNIQKYGRYGKKMKDDAYLVNPCGEICLESKELCNLSETFPPRCKDEDTWKKALEYATFYASTVSLLPTHRPETNAVISRNRRIGVSISGIAQWASNEIPDGWGGMNYTKMTRCLRDGYGIVRKENSRLAKSAGVPESIRVTTVKPSGSISLLAGCTPGVHYPVSRYAIRRMRIGMDSPLVQGLKDANIPWEKDTYSDKTLVFSFAIYHGNLRAAKDVSPWEQFKLAEMMQRCYVDNSVSCTIYFDKKDAVDVEKMLSMFIPVLKCVSLLPRNDHKYAQAPYEEITKEQYEKRLSEYSRPNFDNVKGNEPVGSKFCTGEKCMI
ncbi:fused protease/ribonucleoside-triphosphate reductase, partial [Gammaproteobacteria bacterium]|nr:fused protease/ribonucleoside-triphosphate reductase [Gammaproteobacteria bacterium]